jgi:hypothetical protein
MPAFAHPGGERNGDSAMHTSEREFSSIGRSLRENGRPSQPRLGPAAQQRSSGASADLSIVGSAAASRCRRRSCYLGAYADANVCVVPAPASAIAILDDLRSTLTNQSASLYDKFPYGFEHARLQQLDSRYSGVGRSITAQGRKAAGSDCEEARRSRYSAGGRKS